MSAQRGHGVSVRPRWDDGSFGGRSGLVRSQAGSVAHSLSPRLGLSTAGTSHLASQVHSKLQLASQPSLKQASRRLEGLPSSSPRSVVATPNQAGLEQLAGGKGTPGGGRLYPVQVA